MNPALMVAIMNVGHNNSNNNSNNSYHQNKEKEKQKQAELLLLEREGISMRIQENQKIEVIESYYYDGMMSEHKGWNAFVNGKRETFYKIGSLLEAVGRDYKPKEMQVIPTKVEDGRVSEIQIVLVVEDTK